MATLEKGAEVRTGEIVAPDAGGGTPIVIEETIGEFPHGIRYRARQDHTPVLLTVLDPVLYADLGARAALTRNLQAAARCSHRSLLPVYGWERAEEGFVIVEADPGGTTVRDFARHRVSRGKSLDGETVYTLVAHVCNALGALHPHVHGYVTADTVLVSTTGRVFVSSAGIGPTLPQARGFARFRSAGRLPNVAPEQLLSPPQLSEGTDIFGAATLFIELVTGRPMVDAGQPIAELGLQGPPELLLCLERATAPSPGARPPDILTFKAELSDAVRSGPLQRTDPIPPASSTAPDDEPSGSNMPPHPNAGLPYPPPPPPPPAPVYPPYPPRGRPTPYPPQWPYAAPPQYDHRGPPGYPYSPPPEGEEGPPRRPTPLPSPELEELDRAARRINKMDEDEALAQTSSVAKAVDPNAEDIDEPPPMRSAAASSSLLGLRIGAYESTAARLSTLDGEPVEKPVEKPPGSGAYFGQQFREEKREPATVASKPAAQSGSAEKLLVDRGQVAGPANEASGPRPLAPGLANPARTAVPPAPAERPRLPTIWLIVIVLFAFGVAGLFLMNR